MLLVIIVEFNIKKGDINPHPRYDIPWQKIYSYPWENIPWIRDITNTLMVLTGSNGLYNLSDNISKILIVDLRLGSRILLAPVPFGTGGQD